MSPVEQKSAFAWAAKEAQFPVLRQVRSPRVVRVLAGVLAIAFLVLLLGLVVTPWQQSVTGTGRVVAFSPNERQQKLESPVDGRIARVLVVEGQAVDAGEVVVEVSDVDPRFVERLESEQVLMKLRREAAVGRREQIGERVAALREARELALAAADARVEMGRERVRQAEESVAAAAAAEAAAALNLPRVKSLAAQGLRSARDAELAELDERRAHADEARARATLDAARSEVTSLLAERNRAAQDTSASINDARASEQSAHAEVAAAGAEVVRFETRLARQQTQSVTVVRDAVVLRVLAQEGQLVKQGEPLVELVPRTGERAVEMWLSGNDAPLVGIGREVRLQFEGWPALQFVGWPRAARGTFGGEVALVDSHDDGAGRFRILVRPLATEEWPEPGVLRQGVRTNGWVLLEQVPLGWELWRRLNAFPPSLSGPPPGSMSETSSSTATPPGVAGGGGAGKAEKK